MAAEYEVHVLYDGYSHINESSTEMKANCTCTLIKGPKNIIVDTMTAWDGERIINALNNHNITPDLIDWVVCTHGHSDHIGNNALFLNATHVVGYSISKQDTYIHHDFETEPEYIIDDKVKLRATPGHTMTDVSLIVNNGRNKDIVAVVGDLFEREQDIEDEKLWLEVAGSECPEKQRKNRKYILEMADYIVPGHGPMFTVTDAMRKNIK